MKDVKNQNDNSKMPTLGNVYFLEVAKIYHNKINDEIYGVNEDITQLKENILLNGLQEPLEVVKDISEGNETSSYRLLSGHGRYDSLVSLFGEGKIIKYQDKDLFNKIPCLIHAPFKNQDEETEYLLGGNVRKNRSKESTRKAVIKADELYERKKANFELKKGETKRLFISSRVGISERSVDKYLKPNDENKSSSKERNIQSIDACLKSLAKVIEMISSIEIAEYGKSDRKAISEYLDNIILIAKKKKKEK